MKEKIKKQLESIIRECLCNGCILNINHAISNCMQILVFSNFDKIVQQLIEISIEHIENSSALNFGNHDSINKYIEEFIIPNISSFLILCTNNPLKISLEDCTFIGNRLQIQPNYAMIAMLEDGRTTKKAFGIKPNGEKYTEKEVKIFIKKAERGREIFNSFNRFSRRYSLPIFVSIIADMNIDIGSNNIVRFIEPCIDIEEDYYFNMEYVIRVTPY